MDLKGLIDMLVRRFARRAMDAGVNYAARRGKPEADLTPEERAQAKQARDLAQRAREMQKVTRRLWR